MDPGYQTVMDPMTVVWGVVAVVLHLGVMIAQAGASVLLVASGIRLLVGSEQRAEGAQDLLPALLRMRETWADTIAAVWAAPQWMMFTCEYLLAEFFKEVGIEFPIGSLLQGLPCFSVEQARAAQALGRDKKSKEKLIF